MAEELPEGDIEFEQESVSLLMGLIRDIQKYKVEVDIYKKFLGNGSKDKYLESRRLLEGSFRGAYRILEGFKLRYDLKDSKSENMIKGNMIELFSSVSNLNIYVTMIGVYYNYSKKHEKEEKILSLQGCFEESVLRSIHVLDKLKENCLDKLL